MALWAQRVTPDAHADALPELVDDAQHAMTALNGSSRELNVENQLLAQESYRLA
jgi:hypothetical protein